MGPGCEAHWNRKVGIFRFYKKMYPVGLAREARSDPHMSVKCGLGSVVVGFENSGYR